eukprot:531443-Rhodomonas_salina.2
MHEGSITAGESRGRVRQSEGDHDVLRVLGPAEEIKHKSKGGGVRRTPLGACSYSPPSSPSLLHPHSSPSPPPASSLALLSDARRRAASAAPAALGA